MGAEIYFYCDPEKNTECRKQRCHAAGKTGWNCEITRKQECAKTDRDGFQKVYGLRFEREVEDDAGILR